MKVTAAEAAEAIRKEKGFITHAAKRLGISRTHLHRLINNHPTIKEALEDAKEQFKDFAEGKIYQGINEGNTALIIFYAKTQMKDRGYVERQELTGAGGGPVKIDYSALTDDQLERLANGEPPGSVIGAIIPD